jgi:hypothetical protein
MKYKTMSGFKLDSALEDMAKEIERNAKQVVPHKKGTLQSTISTKRVAPGNWIAAAGKSYYNSLTVPYARRREFETNVSFSEPGKKAHYLRDSAEMVFRKADFYFKKHLGKIL